MTPRRPVPSCSQAPLGVSCCCCKFCEMGGCDVRILHCGCCLHARCCPVSDREVLVQCPICHKPLSAVHLMPMNFEEMDIARRQAALTAFSDKRGKKRKNATVARLMHHQPLAGEDGSLLAVESLSSAALPQRMATADSSSTVDGEAVDLRTGRWTTEETDYCDALIRLFEQGKLPISDGIKLNEFLANMLKSKQARLTKKMKNAKLATRQYKRSSGYIASVEEARAFSTLETEFFASIKCPMERAEIRFHMQKEWRELFSAYCIAIGQVLDMNVWLSSVEELDQRTSLQKDAARMVRRKVMLGHALNIDSSNSDQRGVHIDTVTKLLQNKYVGNSNEALPNESSNNSVYGSKSTHEAVGKSQSNQLLYEMSKTEQNPLIHYASPFIEKILKVIDRLSIPFEHVDVWVPSFVDCDPSESDGTQTQKCRLCFAGCGTAESKVTAGETVAMNVDEKFDLMSFGEYSEKFSFEIGCGLPGRVYSSGVASWEQGIQNAPLEQFERSGGAKQWGIQTVLGIPIPSPSAGRIVVLFYSTEDRPRNLKLVNRLTEIITKLRPSPKWKLVVDVGVGPPTKPDEMTEEEAILLRELLILIQKCMPADKNSEFASFLPGFTSLRLLLSQETRSAREEDLLKSILAVYASYKKSGQRSDVNIAVLTARDFMLLSKHDKSDTTQQLPNKNPPSQNAEGVDHRFMNRVAATANEFASQPGDVHLNVPPYHLLNSKSSLTGDSVQDAILLNTFSMTSQGQDFSGLTLGVSPALHPIVGSPTLDGHVQFGSLANSPTLQAISSQDGPAPELASLGMSGSPISDMLRNDGANYREL